MKLIAALMMAVALPVAAQSVSREEIADQQEKIGLFLKWGVAAEDIGHNLTLWYGRAFTIECERASDVCDVYLLVYQWDNSVLAPVVTERTLISSVTALKR